MNKLRLSLDDLEIEAFETTPAKPEDDGTVDAYQTPTANSGGSCFDPTCRRVLCLTDSSCPTDIEIC